jgi:hypothetical protein
MMNDDQRFFRFIIPGFASLTVTGLAFLATFPQLTVCFASQLSVEGWAGVIIGSGGLGFLLSQTYFLCPCSLIDYRKLLRDQYFRRLVSGLPEDIRLEIQGEWDQVPRAGRRCTDRWTAYSLGTFLWQKLIADREKALNGATSRTASRMAAVGATWIGVLLGFAFWLIIVCGFLPRHTCVWRVLLSASIFVLALSMLWCVHHNLRTLNQELVRLGLATWTPQRYLCGGHRTGNRNDQR